MTISFPDKRHRNGKKVFFFFLLQCNSIASARQFRGTTLSGRIDASLSHSHIHRIALRRGSFPKQFPHPSPDRYLVYAYYAHLITISHVIIIPEEFAPNQTKNVSCVRKRNVGNCVSSYVWTVMHLYADFSHGSYCRRASKK